MIEVEKTLFKTLLALILVIGALTTWLSIRNSEDSCKVCNVEEPYHSGKINPIELANYVARNIHTEYDNSEVFKVHTDDTLVAALLSFMLENLDKPVIVSRYNDYPECRHIPEVMLSVDGSTLLRASNPRDVLISPNQQGVKPLIRSKEKVPFDVKYINPKIWIYVVNMFPGITPETIINSEKLPHSLLFNGNFDNNPNWLEVINFLTKKGVVVVIVGSDNVYPSLIESGALWGGMLPIHVIYAKLLWLLSNVQDRALIGKLIEQNFRGELNH